VHDRLGEHVSPFPWNQEEFEEMANAWVPDEFIFCRDLNIHRAEQRKSAISQCGRQGFHDGAQRD